MMTSVTLGSSVTIQGIFVRTLANGKVLVRVGKDMFAGKPVVARG